MQLLNQYLAMVLIIETVKGKRAFRTCDFKQMVRGQHYPWNRVKVQLANPKLCDDVAQSSGIINAYFGKQFFFWYFESRFQPQKAPLIVYANGALGSSSILGLNSGMFPCQVNRYGNGTWRNPYAWNNFANVLFIDPLGVGFMPSKREDGCYATPRASELVIALRQFLNAHPKLLNVPIHLAGESYGAAMVLEAAKVIVEMNGMEDMIKIQLRSVIVGSAMLDAYNQYAILPKLATRFGLHLGSVKRCQEAVKKCREEEAFCEVSFEICVVNLIQPYQAVGYNSFQLPAFEPKGSKSIDLNQLIFHSEVFINLNQTKVELGIPYDYSFNYINPIIYDKTIKSFNYIKDHLTLIPHLTKSNIQVLYYGGAMDYISNPLGIISTLNLTKSYPLTSKLTGLRLGTLFTTNQISIVEFSDASHHVQMDQSQPLFELVTQWIYKRSVGCQTFCCPPFQT